MEVSKTVVRDFWEGGSCGEIYARGENERSAFEAQATERYRMEPFIPGFARFEEGRGRDVLEIGVGMGADHLRWAQAHPARLAGIDLTDRAVDFTKRRLAIYGVESEVQQGDAENLPFDDASFDIVYSWGVVHCSPDTPRAFREILRVLRPGGTARIMIYHRPSVVGWLLWFRYAVLAGRPWRSPRAVVEERLESPGTKVYTLREARELCAGFSDVSMRLELSNGDLLEGAAGQQHQSRLLRAARAVWPRWFVRRFMSWAGLFLLIEAKRPA